MNSSTTDAATTRKQWPLTQMFYALAGGDAEILADCPAPDRLFVIRIGVHLLLTVTFIFGCLLFSLWASLATDEASKYFIFFLSLSIATTILIVDIYIIHASWAEDGQQALETVSRDQRHRFRRPRSRLLKIAPRLLISLIVSIVIAVFLDLYIYQREIGWQLVENARTATRISREEIGAIINDEFTTQQTQIDTLNKQITATQVILSPSVTASIAAVDTARNQLLDRKRQVDAALQTARTRLPQFSSQQARQFQQQRIRTIAAQSAALQAQLNSNQRSLDEIRRVTPSADSLAEERNKLTETRDRRVPAHASR